MEMRPILSTLMRHKTAASLIVLEITLSCAIICNALFLIYGRLERMERPSGMAESEIVRIAVRGIARNDNAMATTGEDLAALRAIPGVRYASATNQVTFGNSVWASSLRMSEDQTSPTTSVSTYLGGPQLLDTMGLELVAGRRFEPDEFVDWEAFNAPGAEINIPAVIVTRTLAERVFPGENPIGKAFYAWGSGQHRIVGVVAHLAKPRDEGPAAEYEHAVLLPLDVPYTVGGTYLLRVDDPARRDEVIRAALTALERSGPTRILPEEDAVTFESLRSDYYREDRAMAWLLVAVCVALLVVTALGIVGLASFWVQQRTKQIGVRRALGATKGQILRYFQIENFILATMGIVLGMLAAYGINQLLMSRYELPRLPLYYLPIGAVALWLLGQVAVLGPARRAAAVPPAIATRSV